MVYLITHLLLQTTSMLTTQQLHFGVLNGRYSVCRPICKKHASQYYVVGYKGTSPYDLVCSTAHMYHYKWFVQLGNTLSNQKSVLKLDMVSQPIPHRNSCRILLRVRSLSLQILTSITEELKLQTSCNQYNITSVNLRGLLTPLFLLSIS